jgi:hypothetical protein
MSLLPNTPSCRGAHLKRRDSFTFDITFTFIFTIIGGFYIFIAGPFLYYRSISSVDKVTEWLESISSTV